jgi:hypothetical protein
MTKDYRFILFPLAGLSGLFSSEKLAAAIRKGCEGGYRLLADEFTLEPRRILFFFKALAFGLIFERREDFPEPEFDWQVLCYKTRLFSKTVDPELLEHTLKGGAIGGYELFHAFKYPTRSLFFFSREAYFFVFRRKKGVERGEREYYVQQTPYRVLSGTLDQTIYDRDLNMYGSHSTLRHTFRDERKIFGFFTQPSVLAIWEREARKVSLGQPPKLAHRAFG